jgi:hypothetical protein
MVQSGGSAEGGRVGQAPSRWTPFAVISTILFALWDLVAYGLPDLGERLGSWLDLALLLGLLALGGAVSCFLPYAWRRYEWKDSVRGSQAPVKPTERMGKHDGHDQDASTKDDDVPCPS